ncbi:MAG: hypothetical protein NZ455_04145 [Bacteroidia bacterium]|nr:hypothetical protein [Bacteroidia bacterium]MDW8348242.1 hypothetical protein [Bacteroidia bacterium]
MTKKIDLPFTELYSVEMPLNKVFEFKQKIRARLIATLVIVFSIISSSAWTLWHGPLVSYFRYDVLLIPIISFFMKLAGAFVLYYLTKHRILLLDVHSGKITTYYKFFFTLFIKNRFQVKQYTANPKNLMLSYSREGKLFVLYLKTIEGLDLVLMKDKKESNIQTIIKLLRDTALSTEPAYAEIA